MFNAPNTSCPPTTKEPPTSVNLNIAFNIWCNPNGIKSLSRNPNTNVPKYPKLAIPIPTLWIIVFTYGHIYGIIIPKIENTTVVIIGTNLVPPKNPK